LAHRSSEEPQHLLMIAPDDVAREPMEFTIANIAAAT
jgi:hypothetical protein